VLGVLVWFNKLNLQEWLPAWLRRGDGTLRPGPVTMSVVLSLALLGIGLASHPTVTLQVIEAQPIDVGGELEVPATTAAVNSDYLCKGPTPDCPIAGTPVIDPRCECPLPRDGFLKIEYDLGLSRTRSYCIRLSVGPPESMGFADLQTDPAFDLGKHPTYADKDAGGVRARARTAGNYELEITSGTDTSRTALAGRVELRLITRELYPGGAGPSPMLRAAFATDPEGEDVVDALTRCWSLPDGRRMDCPDIGS